MGRLCFKCKETKSISSFHKDRKAKDGRQSWCKQCSRETYTAYKYGIEYAEYLEECQRRQGRCDICNRRARRLVVDHCHDSDRIRGYLCDQCNTSIGKLGDTVESLERVLEYLKGDL